MQECAKMERSNLLELCLRIQAHGQIKQRTRNRSGESPQRGTGLNEKTNNYDFIGRVFND